MDLAPNTNRVRVDEPGEAANDDVPAQAVAGKGFLREALETVAIALIFYLLIRLVVSNYWVDGTSMEPNLHHGQYLLVDKVSYRLGDPQRGDVVVLIPPVPDEDYVKRIIGLPGETVEVWRGQVLINGVALDEPYTVRPPSYAMPAVRVSDDQYYVLGDNRNASSDSHIWGMLPEDMIVGRAWVCYWPPAAWGTIGRGAPTRETTLSAWVSRLLGN